jgi:hypothetical protein
MKHPPANRSVSRGSQHNNPLKERVMAIEEIDPALLEPNHGPVQRELLLSAVLHLMSHYTANKPETQACARLASTIERHLQALASLPDLAPVLRATCEQLSEQWAAIVERSIPKPRRATLLNRLVVGARALEG